jgi:DNA-nicking Smr family endonuclease
MPVSGDPDHTSNSFADLLKETQQEAEPSTSFAEMMKGVKPIEQDKIHFGKAQSKQNAKSFANKLIDNRTTDNKPDLSKPAHFHFSDEYEPFLEPNQTLSFVREGHPSYYAKLLRKGEVPPELILDLHGYNKEQAKFDLAELIENCKRHHIPCACVVHGVSGGILKRKIPHYLIQHPDVVAIHQAPLEWGGQGAVVFLVDLGEELGYLLK